MEGLKEWVEVAKKCPKVLIYDLATLSKGGSKKFSMLPQLPSSSVSSYRLEHPSAVNLLRHESVLKSAISGLMPCPPGCQGPGRQGPHPILPLVRTLAHSRHAG